MFEEEYTIEIEYKRRRTYKRFTTLQQVRKYLSNYLKRHNYNIHYFITIRSMSMSEDANLFLDVTKWITTNGHTTYKNITLNEIF